MAVHGSCPPINLTEAAVLAAAYALVVRRALAGDLSVGELTMYAGAISYFQASLGGFLHHVSQGWVNGLYLRHFFDFLQRPPSIRLASPESGRRVPTPLARGLELRGVSFRYPGAQEWVLRGLSLRIPAGQTVALVGENGSGKTTLVKLLTRLYDPDEGQVLLEGTDIREYDLEDLRGHMAAIFQDYCRYHVAARDNVALGDIARRNDLTAIRRAAAAGQAAELIEGLPSGYDTLLGRRFEGGVELSGGEWQKIALSRAFMRRAQLLILDEPSAALDVDTEYEVYRHFAELTRERTTLLISHRFTTVRTAERMVVLDGGRIAEDGTHEQLLARGGRYTALYTAQARRYRG